MIIAVIKPKLQNIFYVEFILGFSAVQIYLLKFTSEIVTGFHTCLQSFEKEKTLEWDLIIYPLICSSK